MLTIRREQFEVFAQADLRSFEEWVLAHLKRVFPSQSKTKGDDDLCELIRCGRPRAAAYGIQAKRDVCKYVDLMLVLGRDFDTDSRLPWAAEILQKSRDPVAKMHFLYRAATEHISGRRR